ncbi:MAG: hypothetical protein K0S39_3625, partial [Paenibacillus sp.]|nr:hypothetical protein [Paenibacillus sp.]
QPSVAEYEIKGGMIIQQFLLYAGVLSSLLLQLLVCA